MKNGFFGLASFGLTLLIGVIMGLMWNSLNADTTAIRNRVTVLEKQQLADSLNMYYTLDRIWAAIQQKYPTEAKVADSIVTEKRNNHNNHQPNIVNEYSTDNLPSRRDTVRDTTR